MGKNVENIKIRTLFLTCDYSFNNIFSFLHFRSPLERKRLQLEFEPPEFPIMTIRAPVPWKVYVQLARNHLDQVLMTTHPVIQALNLLWHQL